jgi:hypothetical protein
MIESLVSIPLLAKAANLLIPVAATLAKHYLGEDKSLFKDLLETLIDEAEDNTKDRLEEALKKKPDVALAINHQVFMRYTGWVLGELIRQFASKPQFEANKTDLEQFAAQAPEGWITFVQKGSPGLMSVQQDIFLRQMAECMARDGILPPISSVPFITFINWHVRLPKEMQQKLDTYLKQNLDNALHVLLLDDNKEAQQAYKQILLTGVQEIRKVLRHIQDQLQQHGEWIEDLRDSPGFDLHHYAEKLVLHCERIPFSAKAENKGVAPIKLSTVFVEPSLRAYPELDPEFLAASRDIAHAVRDGTIDQLTPEQQQIARKLEARQLSNTPQPAFHALYETQKSGHIILAHAGVGKSSLVRRMALRWAVQMQQPSIEKHPEPLPLLIELKTFANAYGRDPTLSLLGFLDGCEESIDRLDRIWCLHYLRTGAAMLILDGLDEVSQRETRSAIANGASRLLRIGVRVIVTSRREGFIAEHWQQQTVSWTGWILEEFSPEQRAAFIGLILPRLYASEGEWKKKQSELERRFEQQPAIGQLSTNPLLLTLITVLLRTGRLGDNRIALYEEAAELLLDQWEAEHFGADYLPLDADIPCDADTRREIVRRLALKLVGDGTEGGQCFSENLFGIEIFKESIREVVDPYRTNPGAANMAASQLPNYLNERHSVICYSGQHAETEERLFSFIHRTFLEYFIALAWVQEVDNESATNTQHCRRFLLEKDSDGIPNWRSARMANILPFYFGLLPDNFRRNRLPLLWDLVPADEPDITVRHEAVLFSAQVWSEITGRDRKHADFGTQLRQHLRSLMCWKETDLEETGFRNFTHQENCRQAAQWWVQLFGTQSDLEPQMLDMITDAKQTTTLRQTLLFNLPVLPDPNGRALPLLRQLAVDSTLSIRVRNAALRTLDQHYRPVELQHALQQLASKNQITHLSLTGCTELKCLPDLSQWLHLTTLYLMQCTGLHGYDSINGLNGLSQLETLWLDGCTGLDRLPDLKTLHSLTTLDLIDCTGLHGEEALRGLTELSSLRSLNLTGCTRLNRLPDERILTSLHELYLGDCNGLNEPDIFRALSKLTSLGILDVSNCNWLTKKQLAILRKKLNNCEILFDEQ